MRSNAARLVTCCLCVLGGLVGCDDGDVTRRTEDIGRPDMRPPDFVDVGTGCVRRGPEICNGEDDDCDGLVDGDDPDLRRAMFTDPENCGACGNVCGAPQATVECLAGQCYISACEAGFNDQNGDLEDGCESDCIISAGGREECDGRDNDCDGPVDEGFELTTDLAHCGRCGNACAPPANGAPVCVEGLCGLGDCAAGFIDLDGDEANGCEYRCVPNGDREFCNGLDDDCDGTIDEAADLAMPDDYCGDTGACAAECTGGGDCEGDERCSNGVCVLRADGPVGEACETDADCTAEHPGYACVAGSESGPEGPVMVRRCAPRQHAPVCDGDRGFRCLRGPLWQAGNELGRCDDLDNDCDGRVDEDYVDALFIDGAGRSVPRTCTAGNGICRREETYRCADDGDGTICPVVAGEPPAGEIDDNCNARDDDCDERIDEAQQDVWVDMGGYSIYAYEAVRPGATDQAPGLDLNPDDGVVGYVETRACSRPGALPWANVTWADAAAACAAAGARLCTPAEWQRACGGDAGQLYPYGADYDQNACNGGQYDVDPAPGIQDAALVTGGLMSCERGGVYDLSGNLKEWVDAQDADLRAVRGGGFETNVAAGLTCTQAGDYKPDTFRAGAIGFRCCRD